LFSADEVPEHPVTVGSYRLDKYEVTVGRMRNFIAAYDAWRAAGHPAEGEGAHPEIPGSGWSPAWNDLVTTGGATPGIKMFSESAAAVVESLTTYCNPGLGIPSYSATAGTREDYPINCVSWYLAFAFCVWDGGYLPTEAQWEYAAAGGDDNRLYPWGALSPEGRANFGADTTSGALTLDDILRSVGSYPDGAGRWGHLDLAGSLAEWNLDVYASDWYSTGGANCTDCANLADWSGAGLKHPWRGGTWASDGSSADYANLRAAARYPVVGREPGGSVGHEDGIRCARPIRTN